MEPALVRKRGMKLAVWGLAFAVVWGGWKYYEWQWQLRLIRWAQSVRDETGESVRAAYWEVQSPEPVRIEDLAFPGVVSGLLRLGDVYGVRWVVNQRDAYIVDRIPLREILPANVLEVTHWDQPGSLYTRLTALPDGKLRLQWKLCPDDACRIAVGIKDFDGMVEFQGRLEASARFPVDD